MITPQILTQTLTVCLNILVFYVDCCNSANGCKKVLSET